MLLTPLLLKGPARFDVMFKSCRVSINGDEEFLEVGFVCSPSPATRNCKIRPWSTTSCWSMGVLRSPSGAPSGTHRGTVLGGRLASAWLLVRTAQREEHLQETDHDTGKNQRRCAAQGLRTKLLKLLSQKPGAVRSWRIGFAGHQRCTRQCPRAHALTLASTVATSPTR